MPQEFSVSLDRIIRENELEMLYCPKNPEEITVSIEYTPGSGDKPSPLVSGGNDIVEAALDEAAPGEGSYTLRIKGIKAGTATLWISCGDKLASVTVKVNSSGSSAP